MTPGPPRGDAYPDGRFGDERGLVGKILLVWLLVAAVIVVGAIDASSILLSRSRAADLAKDASISAAEACGRAATRSRQSSRPWTRSPTPTSPCVSSGSASGAGR